MHICHISQNEVRIIRKITFLLLAAAILLGTLITPEQVSAADTNSFVGAITTGGGNLYVRNAPSTGSTILTALKKGSYITLLEKSGNWWKVEYENNRYGYCYADYITPVDGKPVQVNTGGNVLNVRTGPGTGYNRIATLPHGTTVMLRTTENGWSRILYHGTKLGYVSSKYLSGLTVEKPKNYPAIDLPVTGFKQTDSRWANYPIGTTGGTIGTIGCATTGIAMMESYRTGTTIYPHEMAKKLSYTAGGSVYWPTHYTVITTQNAYLNKIYSLLSQGKPVLLGAKTSTGRQHWIVITGFTGGDTLSSSGFIIQDPGSHSRTNLQQFLNSFPHFYKYFHY